MGAPSGLDEITRLIQQAGLTDFKYETGTWTPTLQDNSLSDAEGQTYGANFGTYVRVGRTVFLQGRILLSSLGTLTAADGANIAGLPFAINNLSNARGTLNIGFASGLAISAGNSVSGLGEPDTTHFSLYEWNQTVGSGNLPISKITADGQLYFTAQYETDDP